MADFLTVLNNKYSEKYNYIRIKSVDILKISKKIYVTLYIPEDIFDYEFENSDAKAIKLAIEEELNAPAYDIYLYFEKIYFDEETLKSSLVDFIQANYPYVGANINLDNIELRVERNIDINFVIQESVFEYSQKSGFEKGVKDYLQSKYYVNSNITYEIIDDSKIELKSKDQLSQSFRSIFIPISNIKMICGTKTIKGANPMHIAKINKGGDNLTICGKVSTIDCRVWDKEDAIAGKRFYKYQYNFVLDDTSATIRVMYRTNDENCALASILPDTEILIRGRVFYHDRTGKFVMYAKSIAQCTIDFDTIKAQLAPLEPPDEYKYPPQKYKDEYNGYQIQFDIFEQKSVEKKLGNYVVLHYLSVPKLHDKIIFEIAMIRIVDGEFCEYYNCYVKAPKHEKMSAAAQRKVTVAPKLTTIIPDIIKFSTGYTVVALNVIDRVKKINQIAKPLRYIMKNELKEIYPESKTKNQSSFFSYCKENGLHLDRDSSAMDIARCIGQLFLKDNQ